MDWSVIKLKLESVCLSVKLKSPVLISEKAAKAVLPGVLPTYAIPCLHTQFHFAWWYRRFLQFGGLNILSRAIN